MALDNKLVGKTSASNGVLRDVIRQACDGHIVEDSQYIRLEASGFKCTIADASNLTKEIINDKFGFIPTQNILFRLDKFGGFDEGLDKMVRVCAFLINDLMTDCVLFFGEDEPVLWKKLDKIVLKMSDDDPIRRDLLILIAKTTGHYYEFGLIPKY